MAMRARALSALNSIVMCDRAIVKNACFRSLPVPRAVKRKRAVDIFAGKNNFVDDASGHAQRQRLIDLAVHFFPLRVQTALFLALFLVASEKLQECRHLGRW
jgi:hypothetical protein